MAWYPLRVQLLSFFDPFFCFSCDFARKSHMLCTQDSWLRALPSNLQNFGSKWATATPQKITQTIDPSSINPSNQKGKKTNSRQVIARRFCYVLIFGHTRPSNELQIIIWYHSCFQSSQTKHRLNTKVCAFRVHVSLAAFAAASGRKIGRFSGSCSCRTSVWLPTNDRVITTSNSIWICYYISMYLYSVYIYSIQYICTHMSHGPKMVYGLWS